MAHRVGTLSRRQKPLQNRTPLIVYKHEVEDALEYIVETVDNADGHKSLTALGVEKGEADVSSMIPLSRPSGRRQGRNGLWQRGYIFAFSFGKTRKIDDARARRSPSVLPAFGNQLSAFDRFFLKLADMLQQCSCNRQYLHRPPYFHTFVMLAARVVAWCTRIGDLGQLSETVLINMNTISRAIGCLN
jgi:hypothetical protein